MGFSPLGVIVSLAVLLPNLLIVLFPPRDAVPSGAVSRWSAGLERVGQALCLVGPAITGRGGLVWWWTVPLAAGLCGYYLLWIRYLRRGRTMDALYGPLWGFPVPMAVLPVLVFLAAAGWLANPWIAASAVVLALGHIPASLMTAAAAAHRP